MENTKKLRGKTGIISFMKPKIAKIWNGIG